jgi:hypothetical protein
VMTAEDSKTPCWDVQHCPACGGQAGVGIMSLVARCRDCGAIRAECAGRWGDVRLSKGEWIIPREGAD